MDRLDEFVNNLQQEIFDDARKALGEKGFHRWRNPKFAGRMDPCDAHGRIKGICGDTMEMFFRIRDGRITEGAYITDGCASSGVSGSFAVELAIGKTLEQASDITGEDVLNTIGRLPEEDRHCAFLAAETIQDAIRDHMNASRK